VNYNKSAINCIIENLDSVNIWILNRAERIAKNKGLCLVGRQDVEQAIQEFLTFKEKL